MISKWFFYTDIPIWSYPSSVSKLPIPCLYIKAKIQCVQNKGNKVNAYYAGKKDI